MRQSMTVAPFESCVGCFRGDTQTGFLVEGIAEFHIAVLIRAAGLSQEEASGTFSAAEKDLHPETFEEGKVPAGEFERGTRLCEECAAKSGTKVGPMVKGGTTFIYRQSEMYPDGLPGDEEGEDKR